MDIFEPVFTPAQEGAEKDDGIPTGFVKYTLGDV